MQQDQQQHEHDGTIGNTTKLSGISDVTLISKESMNDRSDPSLAIMDMYKDNLKSTTQLLNSTTLNESTTPEMIQESKHKRSYELLIKEHNDHDDDEDSIVNSNNNNDYYSISIGTRSLANKIANIPQQLFEHFIVVGLSNNSKSLPRIGNIHKPELLFYYPPNRPVPPKAHEFCFPNGISPFLIKRTPSCSSLNELLFGQQYLHSREHFYTFILTGDPPLYGICITKPELLNTIPNFFHDKSHSLEKKPIYIAIQRSYCFLSKLPLFQAHFDALVYLLAQDRLITVTRELCSSELNEKKDNVRARNNKDNKTLLSPTLDANGLPILTRSQEIDKELKSFSNILDKNNLLDVLQYYMEQTCLSSSGEQLKFTFPGETFMREYTLPVGNNIDEVHSKYIIEWGMLSLLTSLSLKTITTLLSAILLEQRVVFVCDDLSLLSTICLSMHSMMHPFKWQGLFVPVLPQALVDYLEAPVPFLAGVQVLRKQTFEGLIVDIKEDTINFNECIQPPDLPCLDILLDDITQDYNLLRSRQDDTLIDNPIKRTPLQMEVTQRIFNSINGYVKWLVDTIQSGFVVTEEIAEDSLKIEELKSKFMEGVQPPYKQFVAHLLQTQHFSQYLHSYMVVPSTTTPYTTTATTTTAIDTETVSEQDQAE
ncbi:hypothetical protein SAMD00019534_017620 [Acytostelium subglobosum LB1]|uniref:hypothetical protein n=1 Tax=Acytostelium subglobosum LB1 TaxID=1410327 RepID=UPI0006449BF9|nr:hypothetical protein SAMD00019534_017620 [Acytostelium subglobosum LB1]GAM18587.1 hypothetical protein SAMD00019534_017620 [Acytostelium subglobosum LB1]|eukprot:XP_012757807.1 hypothetical protein SAMD00019534_017620 [Acytostelium subglobosum LB1]